MTREALDKLAWEYDTHHKELADPYLIVNAYRAGYFKAIEELKQKEQIKQ